LKKNNKKVILLYIPKARMAELVDALALGASGIYPMEVQVLFRAQENTQLRVFFI
jgi:hypothetical protein